MGGSESQPNSMATLGSDTSLTGLAAGAVRSRAMEEQMKELAAEKDAKIRELQVKLLDFEREKDTLERAGLVNMDIAASLTTHNAELHERMAQIEAESAEHQQTVLALETQIHAQQQTIAAFPPELQHVEAQSAERLQTIATLQSEIQTHQQTIATLQSQNSTLESEYATLQSQYATLQPQCSTLQSQLSEFQREKGVQQHDLEILTSKVPLLEAQLKQAQIQEAKMKHLEDELERVKNELSDFHSQLAAAHERHKNVEDELAHANAAKAKLGRQFTENAALHIEARQSLESLLQEAQTVLEQTKQAHTLQLQKELQKEKSRAISENTLLKNKLELAHAEELQRTRQEHTHQLQKLSNAKLLVQEKLAKLGDAAGEVMEMREENARMRAALGDVEKVKGILSDTQAGLRQVKEAHASLLEEHEQLQQQHEKLQSLHAEQQQEHQMLVTGMIDE